MLSLNQKTISHLLSFNSTLNFIIYKKSLNDTKQDQTRKK